MPQQAQAPSRSPGRGSLSAPGQGHRDRDLDGEAPAAHWDGSRPSATYRARRAMLKLSYRIAHQQSQVHLGFGQFRCFLDDRPCSAPACGWRRSLTSASHGRWPPALADGHRQAAAVAAQAVANRCQSLLQPPAPASGPGRRQRPPAAAAVPGLRRAGGRRHWPQQRSPAAAWPASADNHRCCCQYSSERFADTGHGRGLGRWLLEVSFLFIKSTRK